MDRHPHELGGANTNANMEAVKKEEDTSQRARLFTYEILRNLVDHSTLISLLEERYGASIVGGRRYKIALQSQNMKFFDEKGCRRTQPLEGKATFRLTYVVHVPEDSGGGSLRVGEYVFEPTGDEPKVVELKTMVPDVSTMSWGERHG